MTDAEHFLAFCARHFDPERRTAQGAQALLSLIEDHPALRAAMGAPAPAAPNACIPVLWPIKPTLPGNPYRMRAHPVTEALAVAAEPWRLQTIGGLMRESGTAGVARRPEAELAAALHFMAGIALVHGPDWIDEAQRRVGAMRIADGSRGRMDA